MQRSSAAAKQLQQLHRRATRCSNNAGTQRTSACIFNTHFNNAFNKAMQQ